MTFKIDCPSVKELDALAKGTASQDESARLRSHLRACPECMRTFNKMSSATLPIRAIAEHAAAYPFLAPPLAPDEMGRLGDYRVIKVLGQGGMGIVFLVENLKLARLEALKVMRHEQTADADGWQRFLLEARTTANIKHENLVTVYNYGEERGVAWFAMELLDGESLDARMKRAPRPDLPEILHLARQITRALGFIHERKLIHRDIKPANLWLESHEPHTDGGTLRLVGEAPPAKIKILDLGLVRNISGDTHLTATGVVMGTPDYMSPEQAAGEAVDPRTDLFSLGAVLYYMTTGRKPFEAPTVPAILMALASKTPTAAWEVNRRIPKALSDLIMDLLSRSPTKRPASAYDVLQRLDAIASGADVMEDSVRIPLVDEAIETQEIPKKPKKPRVELDTASHSLNIQKKGEGSGLVTFTLVAIGVAAILLLSFGAGIAVWKFMGKQPAEVAKDGKDRPKAKADKPGPGDKLVPLPPMPVPGPDAVFVADLLPAAQKQFWPHFKGGPPDKGPPPDKGGFKKPPKEGGKGPPELFHPDVTFAGVLKPKGIFMHPPGGPDAGQSASLTFNLEKKYATFEAAVSLNDTVGQSALPITFRVHADGAEKWKSGPVLTRADTQVCKVNIKGADRLTLEVSCGGDPKAAHGVWIDPFLSK